jgi:phage shock protein A
MKWINQFSLVMRSSVTSLKEMVEDPERMLHQLLIDMEEELDRVRASVAEAIADEIQLRKRSQREQQDVETWMKRATDSMQRGDETAAKSALQQKLSAQQRAEQYVSDHDRQKSEVEKLQQSVRELEDKIQQAKHKKTLLTARMSRAESSQKINQALDRSHSKSAFAQFSRLEAKVDREEAMSEAWHRIEGRDPDAEELARNFQQRERDEQLAEELAKLKAITKG